MPLLTKVAGLVVVATVALQWLDTQPNLDDVAGGAFAPWLHASRVTRFYQQHAPDKIAGVPGVLESYRGREDVLYSKLARKYGVDDSRTTWRVDALAAGRAAVEAAAHAVSRSPAAAEVITRWRAAAPGEKATRAAFAAALLAYLSAAAPRDRVRSLCYLGPAAVALVYGPSPAAFSLRSVVDATVETVRRNDVRGRLVGIGAATAFAATLRPRAGPVPAAAPKSDDSDDPSPRNRPSRTTRLRGISTSQPRRRRDPSLWENVRGDPSLWENDSAEYPSRSRGVTS